MNTERPTLKIFFDCKTVKLQNCITAKLHNCKTA